MLEPFQEEPEEEPEEVEVVVLFDDDDDEDAVQEDQPTPAMGWTIKISYKPECESSVSHHRLMGIL